MLQGCLFPPFSNWKAPTEFPRLSGAKILGLDTETRDPNLKERGPGGARNDGELVGISLAVPEGQKWYFPIAHQGGGNLDREAVLQWLRDVFKAQDECSKVGANILYDLEWLHNAGVRVPGPFVDIQVAEPLLDEDKYGGYSLQNLSKYYLGEQKKESLLEEAAKAFGVDPKGGLWKLPAKYVGPYAEDDALLPLKIWEKQKKKLKEQNLEDVFQLESDLIPILLDVKMRGVRVNVERAEELNYALINTELALVDKISKLAKFPVNPWSPKHCVRIFEDNKIAYPRTEPTQSSANGNPSITGDWLKNHENPICEMLAEFRKTNKMRRDFIEGTIIKQNTNGRIYCQFHQLRADSKGTRSGRFSSSNPNLQQQPSRDSYWGPLIRSLYIPEEHHIWSRHDYSQQEPRVLIHFACQPFVIKSKGWNFPEGLPGAREAAQRFIDDPTTDYHQMTVEEIAPYKTITRNVGKQVNLGMAYRMQVYKLSLELKVSQSEAQIILNAYHKAKPYVELLAQICEHTALTKKKIRTLLGRVRHFKSARDKPYHAINAEIQGSSADITKKAMIDCYNAGYLPHIQVHDELNFSITEGREVKEINELMENGVKMRLPLLVDSIQGENWGECK